MEENLNIINQWGEPQKKGGGGGGTKFWNFSGGVAKDGEHDFWLKFSGGKYWTKLCWKNVEKTFFVCKYKYE